MELLARIFAWLSDHEAGISAVAAMLAIAVILFTALRFLLRRRGETSQERAPAAAAETAPATDSSPADLDPLTVPGFEGRPAIAVLPLDNLSGDPEQEYFADGIAEDLITRLSAWRDFPVIARNSSFTYKGKAVDVKRVSRELGARYVVEGSVRKAGDRVRISAQLIDATTGAHVWAETYDRELREIFVLQDEITEAIVASMHPELERVDRERAVHKEPHDLDAWDCVQRAAWHGIQNTSEENAKARTLCERATELDPRSARAFAFLAGTHYADLFGQWTDSPERSVSELHRNAEKAVELDDRNVYAQIVLGLAYHVSGQPEKAIKALELAVQLNPSAAWAYVHLGGVRATGGSPIQAIEDIETAMRLSPKDPVMGGILYYMGWACFAAERYEEALNCAERSLQRRPGSANSYRLLASSYAHLGRLEEARRAWGEALRRQPDFSASALQSAIPGADPNVTERYIDGLRRAGMKE